MLHPLPSSTSSPSHSPDLSATCTCPKVPGVLGSRWALCLPVPSKQPYPPVHFGWWHWKQEGGHLSLTPTKHQSSGNSVSHGALWNPCPTCLLWWTRARLSLPMPLAQEWVREGPRQAGQLRSGEWPALLDLWPGEAGARGPDDTSRRAPRARLLWARPNRIGGSSQKLNVLLGL